MKKILREVFATLWQICVFVLNKIGGILPTPLVFRWGYVNTESEVIRQVENLR